MPIALAVLVAGTLAALPGSASGADPLLPTVKCPVQKGLDSLRFPPVPSRVRAAVPTALAARLAVYAGGPERVVAPRGWRCGAIAAVNGGSAIVVASREKSSSATISAWTEPACVGCIFDRVCAFFPKESRPLSVGIACGRLPPSLARVRLSPSLVRWSDRGELGLVLLRAEEPFAAGVSCSGTQAGCEAVLAEWRARARAV